MTGQGRFNRRYHYTTDNQLQFIALRNDSRKTAEYQEILRDLIEMIRNQGPVPMNWTHIELTEPRDPIPTMWEGAHADIVFVHPNGHVAYLMLHTQPWPRVKAAIDEEDQRHGEDPDPQ